MHGAPAMDEVIHTGETVHFAIHPTNYSTKCCVAYHCKERWARRWAGRWTGRWARRWARRWAERWARRIARHRAERKMGYAEHRAEHRMERYPRCCVDHSVKHCAAHSVKRYANRRERTSYEPFHDMIYCTLVGVLCATMRVAKIRTLRGSSEGRRACARCDGPGSTSPAVQVGGIARGSWNRDSPRSECPIDASPPDRARLVGRSLWTSPGLEMSSCKALSVKVR